MRQGKTAPNGKIIANITMKGVNALLKKGAPTDIFSSNNISINNGHKVPIKTTIVDTMRSKLLDISALSRLTKENVIFFCYSGLESSINWFVYHELMKNKNSKLFEGSIFEWVVKNKQIYKNF